MDENVSGAVEFEAGQELPAPHLVQTVRHGDWTVVWRSTTGTAGPLYTICDRCSARVVLHPGGFLPDRVTHRCPHSGRKTYEARLSGRGRSSSPDGNPAYWQARVRGYRGREKASEGS